ncbi:MAG: N-acetylmuramoyl-L-alanine amidase, partial [Acidobacteria bacterium]|nr:N-acetylmuramoyl-L-alanine amidase [Acidobacteriota bacterium]
PTSTRADASALAVGELLADQARLDNDEKGFKSAIGQYEFLCREYPGSKYRFRALLNSAEIYREDLGDDDSARQAYEDFLKRYPGHPLAADAKAALRNMERQAKEQEEPPAKSRQAKSHAESVEPEVMQASASMSEKHKGLARISSVRYWSTPDYTRIAIDLGDEVKYEAGRVPSPDRIFFDLHDSHLTSGLIGKSYDVEDGLLKKVRVAQYKPNVARIVLELDSLADYSAFLLPNPYRLIIDVHGRKSAVTTETASAISSREDQHSESNAAVRPQEVGKNVGRRSPANVAAASAPASAPSDGIAPSSKTLSLPPRAEVPLQTREVEAAEIAAISDNPQEVKATAKPTSGPVVQNVARRELPKSDAVLEGASPATSKTSGRHAKNSPVNTASISHEAAPTADGDLSLIRALGLKVGRIVVDAGHGGHDTGTIGPNGLLEKDLVLDVALRLGKLLEQKLGAEVVYTRHDDTFIPLETRTAIANQNQADLFISIHANSSHDPSARGVETYYLNFTRSADALEVAARENAVSDTSVHELQDLVKKIALKEKIEESREFAATVQKALYTGESSKNPGVKDRGVKKAPFIVLIGANMPSILAEVSFVSNPTDERKLRTPEYRQRVAESLYRGVSRYAQGLSGVKVASAKPAPSVGQ